MVDWPMGTTVEVERSRTAMALKSEPKASAGVMYKEREEPGLSLGVLTRATE